jgi:hypothetical protein
LQWLRRSPLIYTVLVERGGETCPRHVPTGQPPPCFFVRSY